METHVQRDSELNNSPEVVLMPQPYPDIFSYQALPTSNPTYPATSNHQPTLNVQKTKTLLSLPWYLPVLITVLVAAVVGLAVGTGVEAVRAKNAEAALDALRSSLKEQPATQTAAQTTVQPTTQPSAQPTSFDAISRNCSTMADTVTGSTYTSFPVGTSTYTIYCNEDSTSDFIMAIFTTDFNACMDACSAYNPHAKIHDYNLTCGSVSFLPPWSNKTLAVDSGSSTFRDMHVAGNCWLKAPETTSGLKKSDVECHAALLNDS